MQPLVGVAGFEPATPHCADLCASDVLIAFRPFRDFRMAESLVSLGFAWCPGAELNHRHADFQSDILLPQPIE
jgi:hypothetical protein